MVGEFNSQLDLSTQLMRYGSVVVSVGEAVLKADPVANQMVEGTFRSVESQNPFLLNVVCKMSPPPTVSAPGV